MNGAGYNPEIEDIPYNLYEETEPYDDQGCDESDELMGSMDNEINLSTGDNSSMLQ